MAGTCSKKVTQLSRKWTFKIHHLMQFWKVSAYAISFPSFLYLSFSFLNPSLHFKLVIRSKEKGGLWVKLFQCDRVMLDLCVCVCVYESKWGFRKWYGIPQIDLLWSETIRQWRRFLRDSWDQTSESQRTEIAIYFSAWRINIRLHVWPAALNQQT